MSEKNKTSVSFPAFRLEQPIGEFYIGAIDSHRLAEITFVDVRRIEGERQFETYLGIQRRLDERRVKEISEYVNTIDACFPTAVILAVDERCAEYDEKKNKMTLSAYSNPDNQKEAIPFDAIAKVLDGQHRIEGLKAYKGSSFQVNVCIFVDIDIAEQAYLFSTVNLAQTKVNKSLAYDLFDLAKAKSPQKLCHNVAVALDQDQRSPLFERIKRLGVATPGRDRETLTQATFVEALMKYVSNDEMKDRDIYLRRKVPARAEASESRQLIFRNMMIENRDLDIAKVVFNYFTAAKARWPVAWDARGRGMILNRTNGFKALMRFLRDAYLHIASPGDVPSSKDFQKVFERVKLQDDDFNIDNFPPGTSGEGKLYRTMKEQSRL